MNQLLSSPCYFVISNDHNDINKYSHHKHLDIVLDLKLDFKFHVDQKIKCNKLTGLVIRISVNFPRKALVTI